MYGVQFLSPWTVVTPQPYRYLEKQHVEAFFADGSLQLSSFARFAQHEDEQRKDESEGKTSFIERSERGENKTIASFIQMGCDAYVLCASSYYSEGLMRLFKSDSWFRINNTTDFANAVSRHVPGFIQGAEGLCIYEESPGILCEAETGRQFTIEEHDGELTYDPAALQRLRDHIAERAGFVPLFLKNASYACQAEHRKLDSSARRLPACLSLRARRRSRSPARER